jgi:hypothetical protein
MTDFKGFSLENGQVNIDYLIDYTNEVNSTACDDTNDCVPLCKIWKML